MKHIRKDERSKTICLLISQPRPLGAGSYHVPREVKNPPPWASTSHGRTENNTRGISKKFVILVEGFSFMHFYKVKLSTLMVKPIQISLKKM